MENALLLCVRVLPLISGLMPHVSEFLNTERIVFKEREINTALAGGGWGGITFQSHL